MYLRKSSKDKLENGSAAISSTKKLKKTELE